MLRHLHIAEDILARSSDG